MKVSGDKPVNVSYTIEFQMCDAERCLPPDETSGSVKLTPTAQVEETKEELKIEETVAEIKDTVVEKEIVQDTIEVDSVAAVPATQDRIKKVDESLLADNEKHDNMAAVVVPEHSYFMMGDNRDNSDDSRDSVGFVPEENLVGKARFLFYSHNEKGAWYKPWTWPQKIRWSRLFDTIK